MQGAGVSPAALPPGRLRGAPRLSRVTPPPLPHLHPQASLARHQGKRGPPGPHHFSGRLFPGPALLRWASLPPSGGMALGWPLVAADQRLGFQSLTYTLPPTLLGRGLQPVVGSLCDWP